MAKKELNGLNSMPQYDYIIEATMAPSSLKPSKSLSDADALYAEAVRLEEQASPLKIVKDKGLLRMALDKYNELISKYPSSDKIDDAHLGLLEFMSISKTILLPFSITENLPVDRKQPIRQGTRRRSSSIHSWAEGPRHCSYIRKLWQV